MKSNKMRSAIIAVIVLLVVGFGIFSMEIEPADDVTVGGDTQQEQQVDTNDTDAVNDPAQDEPAQGALDEPAADDDPAFGEGDEPQTGGDTEQQTDEPAVGGDNAPEQSQPAVDPVSPPAVSSTETGDATQTMTCTIEIRCDTVIDTSKLEDQSAASYIPADGVILAATEVELNEGDTAFDVLKKVTREHNIQMEFTEDTAYGSAYIEGINYLYEFDAGPLSGWMYKVNEYFPNYGTSNYVLSDGDEVVWMYTCDLGTDVGDNSMWN